MGVIRNRLTIVHDYNLERINKVHESAVEYFKEVVQEELSSDKYDVNTQIISPILSSIINGEYTFVIIGDCSKLGWKTSENFEKYREEWIAQNKEIVQNILVVDFGEGGLDAFVTEYKTY